MTTATDGEHADRLAPVDCALLQILEQGGVPLWKAELSHRIESGQHAFPAVESPSSQTVGRHVDSLHDRGYVSSAIINPPSLQRDLIIGYTVTSAGEQALRTAQERLLQAFITGKKDVNTVAEARVRELVETILPEDADLTVRDDHTADEMITVAKIHYMRRYIQDNVAPEQLLELVELTTPDTGQP